MCFILDILTMRNKISDEHMCMINDQNHKTAIAKEWAIVKTLCRSSHRQYALPGAFINETPPAGFRNLPLVLGYAVLDEVLSILKSQGSFTCKSWMLGAKMQAAEKVLPWQNYALVKAGKDARNGL